MNKHWLRLSILRKFSNADNPEAERPPIPWKSLQSWFQNWLSFTLVLTFSCSPKNMCYYSLLSYRALPPPLFFSLTCYPLYITTKREIVFLTTLLLKIQDNNLSNVVLTTLLLKIQDNNLSNVFLTTPRCPLTSLALSLLWADIT